jgi:hypothetical protein
MVAALRLAPTEAARRWAALLQQIFEVDPLACPTCHGAMRIVACITQTSVIDQILTHLRTRAAHATHAGARRPPRRGPPRAEGSHAPHARPSTRRRSPEDGPPTPRHHAGTVGVGGHPTGATDGSPQATLRPQRPPFPQP